MATNTFSYQSGLRDLRDQLPQMLPADALATFDADADELAQNYPNPLQVKVGDQAPPFSLPDAAGKPVSLAEQLQSQRVILTFYRGTWCPYCNLLLAQLQGRLADFQTANAKLIAISPQHPDASLNIQENNELAFPVLSDVANQVAAQYTTVFRNADAPVDTMTELGLDFDGFYADPGRGLPVPAVFIIEQNGEISFAESTGGDYRQRVEPEVILRALNNHQPRK